MSLASKMQGHGRAAHPRWVCKDDEDARIIGIDECVGLVLQTTSEGVLPASLGERRLIEAIPAKRPKRRELELRCRVSQIIACMVAPSQGAASAMRLPPFTSSLESSVESAFRWNTLCNSGGACRRSGTGNRAGTLKNDLARARVRGATHLSYLTDRC